MATLCKSRLVSAGCFFDFYYYAGRNDVPKWTEKEAN